MAVLRCEDVMSRSLRVCHPHDNLLDALLLMKEIDVGFVPVCDPSDNRLVGIITDRDIVLSLTKDQKPSQLRVSDVMARDPVTLRPDDDVMACARAMEDNQLRRIPVVDSHFILLGVISLTDLARKAVRSKDLEAELPLIIQAVSAPHRR